MGNATQPPLGPGRTLRKRRRAAVWGEAAQEGGGEAQRAPGGAAGGGRGGNPSPRERSERGAAARSCGCPIPGGAHGCGWALSCWRGPFQPPRAEIPRCCELSGPSQHNLSPFRGPVISEDPSDPNPKPFCGSLLSESFSTQPNPIYHSMALQSVRTSNPTSSVVLWFCGL